MGSAREKRCGDGFPNAFGPPDHEHECLLIVFHTCLPRALGELDPLEPPFERLRYCHVPRRDDPVVTQGGIQGPSVHYDTSKDYNSIIFRVELR